MKDAITVKYDDTTIPKPIGRFVYIEEDGKFMFSQSFVMSSKNSEHDDVLLRNLSVRNGDLEVEYMGEETKIERKYSDNTAFNTKGIVRKDVEKSFGVKQVYEFVCVGEIPSDETINVDAASFYTSGLQNIAISVSYSTERIETVAFSGRYTVIRNSQLSATEHYEDEATGGKAYADDWLGDESDDTFDMFDEQITPDQFGKSVDFKLTYRTQTLSGLPDGVILKDFILDNIIDVEMSIGKKLKVEKASGGGSHDDSTAAGGGSDVGDSATDLPKFYALKAYFSIDKTKYSSPATIYTTYKSSVRDWTIDYLKSTHGFENAKVNYAKSSINTFKWQLAVDMLVFAPPSSNILTYTIDENLEVETGEFWKKIMDGKHFTYRIWATGADAVKTVTINIVQVDTAPDDVMFTNAIAGYVTKEGKGWRPKGLAGQAKHRWRQTIGDSKYEVFYKSRIYMLKYVEDAETAPVALDVSDAVTGRNMFNAEN